MKFVAARWRQRAAEVFGVDLRSLALFRVALASVTAVDLLLRLPGVRAFYTDFGVMPRAWLAQTGGTWRLNLHLANGETVLVSVIILLQVVLALMVLVGHRTRLATVLTFVLLGSLHNRNPLLLTGGDNLLVALWFWAMFLPIHARWSFDAALSPQPPPAANLHSSWASAGLILQVLYVWFFSAILKNSPDWWPDGTAVWYALSLDRYATPLGVWLRDSVTWALTPLTWYVYFLEWVGPLLALSPFFLRPLRFTVMILLALMHVGFMLCLALGHFPWVSLTSLTVLLGGWWWDWMARRRDHGRHLKIYYDQDCGFCLKSCLLFRHFLVLPRTEILPAQGSARASALMQAQYSWVVIDGEDTAHTKWNAWVALLRHSLLFGWLWRLAALRLWERPGNAVYDWVGRHRGAFGKLTAWLLPERAVRFETGPVAQKVAAFFVAFLLAWNLATIGVLPRAVMNAEYPLLRLLRLDQVWNMFAPRPARDDGWWVAPGRLEDGREVDVLRRGEPLSYEKPRYASVTHEAPIRWRKYRSRLLNKLGADHRLMYARYLCRDWNVRAPPGQRVLSLNLVYVLERSQPTGTPTTLEQRVLWRHDCVRPEAPPKAAAPVADDAPLGDPPGGDAGGFSLPEDP